MFFLPIRPELCCLSSSMSTTAHIGIMLSHQDSQRLPFSIAQSDSFATWLYGSVKASQNVYFSVSGGIQRRTFQGIDTVTHFEDLRVNTEWQHPKNWVSWSMQNKLPNTSDSQLGATDETDWSSMITFKSQPSRHRFFVGSGLAIWGDPNRFASQDDALLFRLQYSLTHLNSQLDLAIGGHVFSPQNPSQTSLLIGGKVGQCKVISASSNIGLTPFAPRFGISIRSEYHPKACTSQKGD